MGTVSTLFIREVTEAHAKKPKKLIEALIDKSVLDDIQRMSLHHSGLYNVASRLALYLTPLLPSGKASFIDVVLSEAMTEWHAYYLTQGCSVAFRAYCSSILNALPDIFNYSVTGKSGHKPFLMTTWDCTRQSLLDWIKVNGVSNCTIHYKKSPMPLSKRETSFMLASHVFNRQEMTMWGVNSETSNINREGIA